MPRPKLPARNEAESLLHSLRWLCQLDRLIQHGGLSLRQIQERSGAARATVLRGIRLLRRLGAPIPRVHGPGGYHYRRRWNFWRALEKFICQQLDET